jgi:hypothetical protein
MLTKINLVIVSLLLQLACQPYQSQPHAERIETRAAPSTAANSASPQSVETNQIKLYPVDEAHKDPSFAEFRRRLLKAADNHDSEFILSILDPEIINRSDGERGEKEFIHLWKLKEPDNRFWEVLTSVLSLGGSFRDNAGTKEFCAPYVTSKWPTVVSQLTKDADPLDFQVITDKNIPLRSEPNPGASVVVTLEYDVVRVYANGTIPDSKNSNTHWLKISTVVGQHGFVPQDVVRSPSDYQACFRKTGSRWLMTELASRE